MGGTLRIGDIEVHPAANLFPEMGDDDLDALYESVKAHGIRVPLVFHGGKLLDGRNRLRASVMAGLDTSKLPRRTLDPDSDPYQWAWDANCSRLDYSPAQKAAIRIKIEEASGELQRAREEAARKANEARAAKQAGVPKAEAAERRAPPDAPRSRERDRIAEAAHVSPKTVERVQRLKKDDPEKFEALAAGRRPAKVAPGKLPAGHPLLAKRRSPTKWSLPWGITDMARFIVQRRTSTDVRRLIAELTSLTSDETEAA